MNQQLQVSIPSGGSNWNQAKFDSVVIQEAEALLNMKQTVSLMNSVSNASPPRIVTATAQENCLDILARAALSEPSQTTLPSCEEDEYYSD